ncbi:helix-turn-helix domain-containing protein [Acutalibacter sp. 1XD8-33]|uniref:helix-turn-helix domain-containing protein n=1 Tax=Acutalibacter sp. 1XD8-33 TaxID=2320081 RepID=UPI001FA9DC68|nr:helix-turn-helix transcriptional regulator [Acutalibacter sp. 1XD8-33]
MNIMEMADRIQSLRKARGLSQEELAERLGISRQAVSKWESGQSMPELDKVTALSDCFGVTTDYLLKGVEPEKQEADRGLGSRVLYIASTAIIFIGLFAGCAGWYEDQSPASFLGGMCAQAMGAAGYFIGKVLSGEKPPFAVKWLNVLGGAFMPCSILAEAFFRGGSSPFPNWPAPYPVDVGHLAVFLPLYLAAAAGSWFLLRRAGRRKRQGSDK